MEVGQQGAPVERWHAEREERKVHKRERNLSCVIILSVTLAEDFHYILGPNQANTLSVSIFSGLCPTESKG